MMSSWGWRSPRGPPRGVRERPRRNPLGLGIDAAGMGAARRLRAEDGGETLDGTLGARGVGGPLLVAMPTRARRASSVTSRTPRDTTGTSMRMEHLMEQTVRLSLAVTLLAVAGVARAGDDASTLVDGGASTERMKGSKRRTRVQIGDRGGVLGGVLVAGVAELAPHGGHHGVGVGGVVVHVHPLAAFHPRRARRGRGIRRRDRRVRHTTW